MPAGVGVGGTLLLLGLALIAAYFNAKAEYDERQLALLKKNTPPIVNASGDLPVPVAVPAPVVDTSTPSPSPPLPATPALEPPPVPRELKVEPPKETPPQPVAPSSSLSSSTPTPKVPSPPVDVPTKAAAHLSPAPEPARAAPATSSSQGWVLSIFSMLLVVLGGMVAAIALLGQAGPSYPPPADAGVAFAAALSKLPRARLPLASSGVRSDSDTQRDKGLVPSQHRSKILSPGSQPAFLTSPLPKSNSVTFTSQTTSPAILLSPSAPAVTPIAFVREPSREIPPPPTQAPPPVPASDDTQPQAPQRSDLAFSSSRFMMGVVGKGTPQSVDSPATTMRTEDSQSKTWKWRENEARRKEEAARTLPRDGSADALPSPQPSQAPQQPFTPAKASNGTEAGVVSTPLSPMLANAEGSEDGARKEEARLARSMSKKGVSLSKSALGV